MAFARCTYQTGYTVCLPQGSGMAFSSRSRATFNNTPASLTPVPDVFLLDLAFAELMGSPGPCGSGGSDVGLSTYVCESCHVIHHS